ncbi:MAG: hypothetical protein AAFW75_30505 [Cyanobacteria bacterium J06636_16]
MGYEVDFLAVGEGGRSGDAIALRFGDLHGKRNQQMVVVIDGGYKESGKDLVEFIQGYYQTNIVDLVISTHPDADHASGLSVVLEEMTVGELWLHQPWKRTEDIAKLFRDGRVTDNSISKSLKALEAAANLEKIAESKGIPIVEPFVGVDAGFKNIDGHLYVLGPTLTFYEEQLPDFRCTPEPKKYSESIFLGKVLDSAVEFVQKIAESWD